MQQITPGLPGMGIVIGDGRRNDQPSPFLSPSDLQLLPSFWLKAHPACPKSKESN